jgi:Rrf2 family protein
MKLSLSSSHALHAVCSLAAAGGREPLTARHLAPAAGASAVALRTVLRLLVEAGVLSADGGPNGGYRLSRPADKVTLLEVVEAIDGPVRGEDPFADRLGGQLQAVCDDLAALVRQALGRVRLSDLAGTSGGKKT